MKNKPALLIILISLAVVILAGFFASSHPDGLLKVSGDLKLADKAASTPGIFVDYTVSIIHHPAFSRVFTGIIGLLIIIFIFKSIARVKYIGEKLKKILKLR
jgi:hypothetical protein